MQIGFHFLSRLQLIIITTFIAIGLKTDANGQAVTSQKSIGGFGGDYFVSLLQTADGGYMAAGHSSSGISGDKTALNRGASDYWILKLDSNLNILWQKTIGGTRIDNLASFALTPDGGYICAGWSFSGVAYEKTIANFDATNNTADYWLVKLDSIGNIQWQKTYGGNKNERCHSISVTSDGGYIVGGHSESNISGNKTSNSWNNSYDYWILKLDALGNITWQRTIGGTGYDILYNVRQTSDGGFICIGTSYSNISGDKTVGLHGLWSSSDIWLVKLNAFGTVAWQLSIGGDNNDHMVSVDMTSDGGMICAGTSLSDTSGDKTEMGRGDGDIWVVKFDSLYNIQWQKTLGGNGFDAGEFVKQTSDGGYVVIGSTYSSQTGDMHEPNWDNTLVSTDSWIIKFDSTGTVTWQNVIGGDQSEEFGSVVETSPGNFLYGLSSLSGISGDKNLAGKGGYDYWICGFSENYNELTGTIFMDTNGNGMQDLGENGINKVKVTDSTTGTFAFSHSNGSYSMILADTGNFTVATQPTTHYSVQPSFHNAYFNMFNQVDSLNDFAFAATTPYDDLSILITPYSMFRQGMPAYYELKYKNEGNTNISGEVVFYPYGNLTYTGASVLPGSVTQDSIIWQLGNLAPYQTGSILVKMFVNIGTTVGSYVGSSARINPTQGDFNPVDNYSLWELFTTAPFDPNDITVDKLTLFTYEIPNPPYLDYVIRFQNTGTDTAFQVVLLNPIDVSKLSLGSLDYVSSSHPVNINYLPWERNLQFKFSNIQLPDSTNDEPGSHGFVRYRIKPFSNLAASDTIKNKAFIYFDYEPAIKTNTATTVFILFTGTPHPTKNNSKIQVYPNPANHIASIRTDALRIGDIAHFGIYNSLGLLLKRQQVWVENEFQSVPFDIADFIPGIYFVQVSVGDTLYHAKFIKH